VADRGGRGAGGVSGLKRVGDVLAAVLEQRGLSEQVERAGVVDEWADRVGEKISSVTRAVSVDGRRIVVEVKSSVWLMELNLMKREILARLNEGRSDAPIERIIFVLAENG